MPTKKSFSVVDMLMAAVQASIASSTKDVVRSANTAKKFEGTLAVAAETTFETMKEMDMGKETRLLSIFLNSAFGRKGIRIPDAIRNFSKSAQSKPTVSTMAAPITQKPITLDVPKPTPSGLAPSAPTPKPQQPAAPARTLTAPSGDFQKWKATLKMLVEGKKIIFEQLQKLTTQIFRSAATEMSTDDWTLFFGAMMAAEKAGKYILAGAANPLKVFGDAPTNLLLSHVFGEDALFGSCLASLNDLKAPMPMWLGIKISILLDAIMVLDEKDILNREQSVWVENFLTKIEGLKLPGTLEFLSRKIGDMPSFSVNDLEDIHAKAAAGGVHNPFQVLDPEKQEKIKRETAPIEIPTTEPKPVAEATTTSEQEPNGIPTPVLDATPDVAEQVTAAAAAAE